MPEPADADLQSDLLGRGRETIIRIHQRLVEVRQDPDRSGVRQHYEARAVESGVDTTFADHEAELVAFRELKRPSIRLPHVELLPIGEELMKGKQWPANGLQGLDPSKQIVALVDPLDGTKLEAREIPTWCIALVFYRRETGHILAATVGQATGSIYFAASAPITARQLDNQPGRSSDSESGRAWRQVPKPDQPWRGGWIDPASPEPLGVSAEGGPDGKHVIAFVAPSPSAFLWASRFVRQAHESDPMLLGRVYNMGGNPMLAKIADGTIDAVVGFGDMDGPTKTKPQKPHDYVPGVFIARQAGATAVDIDTGNSLDLESALLEPDRPGRRYIVARTAGLAERCLSAVQAAGLVGRG